MADSEPPRRIALQRGRSNFLTRTATDTESRLVRRLSVPAAAEEINHSASQPAQTPSPYEPLTADSEAPPRSHKWVKRMFGWTGGRDNTVKGKQQSSVGRHRSTSGSHSHLLGDALLTAQLHRHEEDKESSDKQHVPRIGSMPRPIGGTDKMDTFSGVFVPTTLNVLSILMFIRFGFILGQSGIVGMMGMLVACYLINLITTMSISAIATNGTVRGGGAYYLISRSLGPEFGGSIGIVFYVGFVFNTGMNAVGLIDCLNQTFGSFEGIWGRFLKEGFWWQYLWATIVMVLCTAICLAGSGIFARCSNGLLVILLLAAFSIPVSTLFVQPFENPELGLEYTGLSAKTLLQNLMPRFTKGAAGSQLHSKETFQDLFGILFPATGGIFAGASMSGDLKNPSKSIPKGTLYGLLLTFCSYTLVILAMGASITRGSFYRNVNVLQDVNLSSTLILAGECATSLFSALMGVIGPAKLLQAIARDNLIPGLSIFGQGTAKKDEPTYAILMTFVVTQLTMLCDINQIASVITMTYLMTFLVMNLACFCLKISSAPNFRPSFHYFNWYTAFAGTIASGATMFFVDGLYATGCVGILVVIFLIIHYTSPPKSWGDVSQSLIYHQVRKYLLRLKQEHVKFWRPQILLFINDPRHQYKLIQFCNSLKKGALFILGHVIVSDDFGGSVPEARKQQVAWGKYIDFSRIKAFVNIAISPGLEWGCRNIVLSAGLGGMRPNIVVMGFYNLDQLRRDQPLVDVPSPPLSRPHSIHEPQPEPAEPRKRKKDSKQDKTAGLLPTDTNRIERAVGATSYVTVLEDMLLRLRINVAIAKGFQSLEFPDPKGDNDKKYIDLWPIQMSAEIAADGDSEGGLRTVNFDTYTLILQLGCILNTVPRWKEVYRVRVIVFVEYETDVEEERGRVATLLENLRIQAQVLVFCLASGSVVRYQVIVNGNPEVKESVEKEVNFVLKDEDWWQDLQKLRGKAGEITPSEELAHIEGLLKAAPAWPNPSIRHGRNSEALARFEKLKRFIRHSKKRSSISDLASLGVSFGMRTHHLDDSMIQNHASHQSASEASSSDGSDSDSIADYSEEEMAASEADIDDFSEASEEPSPSSPLIKTVSRRRSHGDSLQSPKKGTRKPALQKVFAGPRIPAIRRSGPQPDRGLVDVTNTSTSSRPIEASDTVALESSSGDEAAESPTIRSHITRRSSAPKLSSPPIPETHIPAAETGGPSIMFTEPVLGTPRKGKDRSIYARQETSAAKSFDSQAGRATGYPVQQSIPLSFNDLPSRAQHFILNELMQNQSKETAVIFTTLPPPREGTHESEKDSIGYLSDLEVLCQDLPPVLLVHSNSMTVTMNL